MGQPEHLIRPRQKTHLTKEAIQQHQRQHQQEATTVLHPATTSTQLGSRPLRRDRRSVEAASPFEPELRWFIASPFAWRGTVGGTRTGVVSVYTYCLYLRTVTLT